MNEVQAAEAFLYQRLSGAAAVTALVATRIYASLAPEGAARPYLVFSFQGGADRATVGGGSRIFSRPVMLVKGIGEGGSYVPADQVASALDDVLLAASGSVVVGGVTYQVAGCVREQPVRYVELDQGRRFYHAGGLYRLLVHRL